MENNAIVIFITAPTEEIASSIAHSLLEKNLIACANLIPGLKSIYRWKGAIETSSEVLIIAKTTSNNLIEAQKAVLEAHPYDTPEFIAIDCDHVEPRYLAWLNN